jgi:putative aldouronate transport system substrate-binding protein
MFDDSCPSNLKETTKMKKTMSLLLILIMAFSFVACSSNTDENSPSIESGTPTPELTEDITEDTQPDLYEVEFPLSPKPVELTAWCTAQFTGAPMTDYNDSYARQEYEKMSNVSITWQSPSSVDATTSFNLMIASGDYTDFIISNSSYYTGGIDKYIQDDIILDLTPYVEHFPNYMRQRTVNDDALYATITNEGRIGFLQDLAVDLQGSFLGFAVRADRAEALGVDYTSLVTYADYESFLEKTRDAYGDVGVTFYTMTGLPNGIERNLMVGYGINTGTNGFFSIDDTMNFTYTSENYRSYLEMVARWYNKGILNQNFTSVDRDDITLQTTGKSSVSTIVASYIPRLNSLTEEEGAEWRASATPVEYAGQTVSVTAYGKTSYPTNSILTLTTNCSDANIPIVLKYHDYFYSEEGCILRNFGIENQGFTYQENGVPILADVVANNPEGYSQMQMKCLYAMPHNTAVGLYEWDSTRAAASNDYVSEAYCVWDSNWDGTAQP